MHYEIHAEGLSERLDDPRWRELSAVFSRLQAEHGHCPLDAFMGAVTEADQDFLVSLAYAGEGDYRYSFYGSSLRLLMGTSLTGTLLSTYGNRASALALACYERARQEQRPILAFNRSAMSRHVYLWKRLALPCRDAHGRDHVVALVQPKLYKSDLLEAVSDATSDGIISVVFTRADTGEIDDAIVATANEQAAALLGCTPSHLLDASLGVAAPALFPKDHGWMRCLAALSAGERLRYEVAVPGTAAASDLRVTCSPLKEGFVVTLTDISELREALRAAERAREAMQAEIDARLLLEGELRRISITDPLTSLFNRRGLGQVGNRLLEEAHQLGERIVFVSADIDFFKHINDRYGHSAGDQVLIRVAEILADALHIESECIARVGGEEFVFVLTGMSVEQAVAVAERVRLRILHDRLTVEGTEMMVTASFGVAEIPPGHSLLHALGDADKALYHAKRAGRNRTCVAPRPELAPAHPRYTAAE